MNHGRIFFSDNESTMVDYADRLRTAMQHKGMTTTNLARELDLTYQAVKKVLDGKTNAFSAENNSHAARHLDVSTDWLATGEGPMTGEAPPPMPVQQAAALTVEQALEMLRQAARRLDVTDRAVLKLYLSALVDEPDRADLVDRALHILSPPKPSQKPTPETGALKRAA